MMLTKDVELIDGLPIIYIKSLSALVCADLHLGYEGVMAKKGSLLPKVNLKSITESLAQALERTRAKQIIVDGDIKNEFSNVDQEEFNELYDFVQFAKEKKVQLVLIKGNHDNFVERYKEPFKLVVYRQEAKIGKYLFFHGEEPPKDTSGVSMAIMGHEHPSIGIYNAVGTKEKVRCFLLGSYRRVPLLVLPAINYYAAGTDVNIEPSRALLSPVFKHADIDRMKAIAIGYGSTIDFGVVGKLRNL
ncbi:MAG: metallophosphoesterase [Candidatus Micrarchaeales archaeon]|nr:metallophosphoesterase [Candidatus Micrarchaeales archaeon]